MPSILILKNGRQIPVPDGYPESRRLGVRFKNLFRRFLDYRIITTGHPVRIRKSEVALIEYLTKDEWAKLVDEAGREEEREGRRIVQPKLTIPKR